MTKSKIETKMPPKITKTENIAAQDRGWINSNTQIYWCTLKVYKVWKPPKHSLTLWKIGKTYLFSKTWSTHHSKQNEDRKPRGWERDISHNITMVLFIVKTKRLECPCGLKEKLHLMKGSLVRHLLRCTWRHRTDHLSLHFHSTSVMMPHAPPAVAHLLVLRQNWETLAWLASRQSKPSDVNACPHIVFINSSILRANQQTSSHLVLRPEPRDRHGDFETQITKL
jgi:hypothetical protein